MGPLFEGWKAGRLEGWKEERFSRSAFLSSGLVSHLLVRLKG
jgi:hypothetical protein